MEYITKDNDDECLNVFENRRLTDDEAIKIIKLHYKVDHAKRG